MPFILNSGVLIMIINNCIRSVNESNQHDKTMVINMFFLEWGIQTNGINNNVLFFILSLVFHPSVFFSFSHLWVLYIVTTLIGVDICWHWICGRNVSYFLAIEVIGSESCSLSVLQKFVENSVEFVILQCLELIKIGNWPSRYRLIWIALHKDDYIKFDRSFKLWLFRV